MTEVLLAEIDILKKKCEKYEQAIEDIKAEISRIDDFEVVNGGVYVREFDVIEIIDRHMSGKEQE